MKTAFWWGKLKERDEDTDRINVAQDRDKWWPVCNTVMNPQWHTIQGISQLCNTLRISEEEFCSMEFGSYYHLNSDFWDTVVPAYPLICGLPWLGKKFEN
jgi:hypothetical protein